jgi:hypothetical protein
VLPSFSSSTIPFQGKETTVALSTAIGTDEEKAEDMFADALAMSSVGPALTAVRARGVAMRPCGHRPSHRLKIPEPSPRIPREAEIKVATVGTPEVADANPSPEHLLGHGDAFLRPTTLLVTKRTGRHPERSPYGLFSERTIFCASFQFDEAWATGKSRQLVMLAGERLMAGRSQTLHMLVS